MATEPASLENLRVLYHSHDYVVVDKHWDLRIDSKMWYEKLTVQAQLQASFPPAGRPQHLLRFQVLSPVGFLDKWSSLCCPQQSCCWPGVPLLQGPHRHQSLPRLSCEKPKTCRSELAVLEYGLYDGEPVTKALLQPLTGRTHQLRVHCSAIGHPIVGDVTYSCGADAGPYRMMLHAHLLHLPLEPQPLLVCAGDPFVPSVDPKWLPQRSLRMLSAAVASL
ncbi:unnamed protein product, partial [Tetraodon nigroviridis]